MRSAEPIPHLGGRTFMEVFRSAANGNGDDQLAIGDLALRAVERSHAPAPGSLEVAEVLTKMALMAGTKKARSTLAMILLKKAVLLGIQFDRPAPSVALEQLAEAASFLDEMAGEDDAQAADNLAALLDTFGAEDRAAIVHRANEIREWRELDGVLA